jgi:choline dehydrogenase-like flavoprotein
MREAGLGEPVFDAAMLARHGGDPTSAAFLEEFARSSASTLYHPTSTCKIGAVVDPKLRVLGVRSLRVADASVMPTIISGNTNAPSIAIGERAADFIKREHGMTDSVVTRAPPPSALEGLTPVVGAAAVVLGAAAIAKCRGKF